MRTSPGERSWLQPRWVEPPRISPPTRSSLLRGVLAFRVLVGAWMVIAFVWEVVDRERSPRPSVAHPVVGGILLAIAVALIIMIALRYPSGAERLLRPSIVLAEVAVAATLLFFDTWVYGVDHSQALPTIWPLAAIFTVAIAGGPRAALVTGIGFGLARYAGWLLFPIPGDARPWSMARIASIVLFGVAAWVAGYLLSRQERSDSEISSFRAREEVARTLHDGVLQTLAVVQRRSDDDQLVSLARQQEHELREFLFGTPSVDADIASALRGASRRAEQRYGLRTNVVCAPDLPRGDTKQIEAIGGAVSEALTNAIKHGDADKASIYAEPAPDEAGPNSVFVSVKDNGVGFDSEAVSFGEGLRRSVLGRVTEAGGRVEIDGRPGRGCEVRLWV